MSTINRKSQVYFIFRFKLYLEFFYQDLLIFCHFDKLIITILNPRISNETENFSGDCCECVEASIIMARFRETKITYQKYPIAIVTLGFAIEFYYIFLTFLIIFIVSFLDASMNLPGSPTEASLIQFSMSCLVNILFLSSSCLIFFFSDEIYPSAGFNQGEYSFIVINLV